MCTEWVGEANLTPRQYQTGLRSQRIDDIPCVNVEVVV